MIKNPNLVSKPAVLVATHPRSGTHLTIDLLRRNFPDLDSRKKRLEPLDALYVAIDTAISGSIAERTRVRNLINRHAMPILKSHWLQANYDNLRSESPDICEWLEHDTKVVYVLRHPSKVLASHFLFESIYSDSVNDRAAWLEKASSYWRKHVTTWTARPDVFVIKFEDIVANPHSAIEKLSNYMGIDADAKQVIVGPRDALERDTLWLEDMNWLGEGQFGAHLDGTKIRVKVRSTRPPAPARLKLIGNEMAVVLDDPDIGLSPGQACVFYEDRNDAARTLGGGWITRTG